MPIATAAGTPYSLAMMAGWIDSTAFGAFDPADNNGFAREITGMPSTDPDRMKAYFEGELARQGGHFRLELLLLKVVKLSNTFAECFTEIFQ